MPRVAGALFTCVFNTTAGPRATRYWFIQSASKRKQPVRLKSDLHSAQSGDLAQSLDSALLSPLSRRKFIECLVSSNSERIIGVEIAPLSITGSCAHDRAPPSPPPPPNSSLGMDAGGDSAESQWQ